MSPTIVTLAPLDGQSDGVTTVISSSFEEAFGEFSELRGRGRKRRNNRRTERQQNRIGRRRLRRKSRQEMKDDTMESRQRRKTRKREHKLHRKSMGDQEDGDEQRPDEQPSEGRESEDGYGSNSQEQSDSNSQESDSSQEQQGYEENQGQSSDDSQNDNSQGDESQDSGSQDEGQSSDSYESGFDGVIGAEDGFNEMNDEGKIRVHPSVKDTAKKIEWNKEKISRLRKRSEYLKTKLPTETNQIVKSQMNREIGDISREAKEHIDRVNELESKLTKYTNFEGEFSGVDGQFSEVRGGIHNGRGSAHNNGGGLHSGRGSHLVKGRHREVTKAKKEAKHERSQITKDKITAIKNKRHPHENKNHGGCETPIESSLSPVMSEHRIEIPAKSNFSGTGLNGLDLQNDYDAPPARIIELKSNVDGDKSVAKKLNYEAIAVGVGVAIIAIWAIKKYKILGS